MGLKIDVLGVPTGKNFDVEVEIPLGNKSLPKHVVWHKNGGDSSRNVFSRAAQEVSKKYKKGKKDIWTWYFTPMPGRHCGVDFHNFWRMGSYRRHNYPRRISSRSVKGFGSTDTQNRVFPIDFDRRPYNSVTHYRATLWLECSGSPMVKKIMTLALFVLIRYQSVIGQTERETDEHRWSSNTSACIACYVLPRW